MTPTAFEFTVTMPCDARLVEAVRLLVAQAAGYAQLTPDAGQGLANEVANAAEAAMAFAGQNVPVEFQFAGDPHNVKVLISCQARASMTLPRSLAADGLSVQWRAAGSQHTCHIQQRVPA